MRKIPILILFLFFFAFTFPSAQISNIPNSQLNQVFLRMMSFIYKINYFDQKLNRAKITLISPTSKSKFKLEDNLNLRWKLEFPEKLTKSELSDTDYSIPYSWRILLFNYSLTSTPFIDNTLPFDLSGSYQFSFEIPLSFNPSPNYFFKIELRNNFSNKIIKEMTSPNFQILSLSDSKIKLVSYTGYLLKFPSKTSEDYEHILFTSSEIYFLKSKKINLDPFDYNFVKINGKEISSKIKNLKAIEVIDINYYR
jgi:hypothetical protein